MTETILVTGATGNTGSGLVPALLDAEVNVRAFIRDEEKAPSLEEMGVEVVMGDLDEPDTIPPAVEGVDKIYLLTWNGPTQAQQAKAVIKAAKEASRPHIVRHSMWGPKRSRIVQQGDEVEAFLQDSGLPWTILKPTFFMQNLLGTAPTVKADGVIYWDLADAELATIDIRDIVASAVAALTGSGHQGKTYILTGPEAITMHEVAEALSDVLDKDVSYVSVSHEAALQSRLEMGFPEWIARGYGELMEGFIEGFADEPKAGVETLTGREPRPIDQFARDFAPSFREHD
ncbi:MAG: SDR family oxidoreductase [Candidatus Promineifilaceae bacterium]|nr:SDR family oxidoreductase [Candidatus Promineifilaceae bacterium]